MAKTVNEGTHGDVPLESCRWRSFDAVFTSAGRLPGTHVVAL